jgi:hypothetical protein
VLPENPAEFLFARVIFKYSNFLKMGVMGAFT